MPKKIAKVELPLTNDVEVRSLVDKFEQRTLPYENWTHRAHLAVAVSYVRRFSFDDALSRIRKNIVSYNRECGNPDGYNETITIVFLRKIKTESTRGHSTAPIHTEVARLAQICTSDWLQSYYSLDLISSTEAKTRWIPPDLAELDF